MEKKKYSAPKLTKLTGAAKEIAVKALEEAKRVRE
jgi:hypothetical protein